MMMMKTCSRCGIEKNVEEFSKCSRAKDKLTSHCKACDKVRNKLYREANLEKERRRCRKYRSANRDKARARQRRWRENNPDKWRAQSQRYRKKNGARRSASERERSRRYRREHPEATSAAARRWAENNPDKARARVKRRRARKAGATIGDPKTIAAREAEIRESRWCVECKAEVDDLHVDHIIPLSKGGSHSVENLQGLCARHNLEKGAKLLPVDLEAA